jgi:hypothetical protein
MRALTMEVLTHTSWRSDPDRPATWTPAFSSMHTRMTPTRGSYIGTVDDLLAWSPDRLATFRRAGVIVRLTPSSTLPSEYLFPLQARPYGMLIRDFAGHVEPNEHPVHAAVREALEESLFVFRPWLRLDAMGKCRVFAFLDNMYILIDIRHTHADVLRKRFKHAQSRLTRTGTPIPPELMETVDMVSVPESVVVAAFTQRTAPVRYETYLWSKNLCRSLQGLCTLLRRKQRDVAYV